MTMAAIAVAVLTGAAVVRMTGLGFTLIASPLLILLLGPFQGVLLCNLLSLISSATMLLTHAPRVEWRRAAVLIAPGVVIIPAGAALVRRLPAGVLSLVIGVLLLMAIAAVVRGARLPVLTGRGGTLYAGAASAAMNVLAGVGGPALALYGLSRAWTGAGFVATVPVCSIAMNLLSLGFKGLPSLTVAEIVVVVCALVVGIAGGEALARRTRTEHARWLITAVAAAGAVAATVRGIAEL